MHADGFGIRPALRQPARELTRPRSPRVASIFRRKQSPAMHRNPCTGTR